MFIAVRPVYFFSGVTVVLAIGVAFVSPFFSSSFFSSFLSSFEGLAVGEAVEVGLATGAGVWTATGVETGVDTGLFCVAASLHAAENAVIAAKTVSRIDLLIVFP